MGGFGTEDPPEASVLSEPPRRVPLNRAHQQQSEFPKCMNGIGLRSLFKKSQSVDFVAALLDALPKFLDSTDGSKRGLANWLAPVLGADLFEKCN